MVFWMSPEGDAVCDERDNKLGAANKELVAIDACKNDLRFIMSNSSSVVNHVTAKGLFTAIQRSSCGINRRHFRLS